MKNATIVALVFLAGCGGGGPGRYTDDDYPLKIYPTVGYAQTGNEKSVIALLKKDLQPAGLWTEVKKIDTQKDMLLIHATPRAHDRIGALLRTR